MLTNLYERPPKITGLLNNCAINCAIPTILKRIAYWAELEETDRLDGIKENAVYQQYALFKEVFAGHYGMVEPQSLTWQQFNYFLNAHHFFAIELIFAPVFRNFIAKNALTLGGYLRHNLSDLRDIQDIEKNWFDVYFYSAEQLKQEGATECYAWHDQHLSYIDSTGRIESVLNIGGLETVLNEPVTSEDQVVRLEKHHIDVLTRLNLCHRPKHVQYEALIAAGRYNCLEYSEVVRLFYAPLGIQVEVWAFDDVSRTYVLQPASPFLQDAPGLPLIEPTTLYLRNHHYELQQHEIVNGVRRSIEHDLESDLDSDYDSDIETDRESDIETDVGSDMAGGCALQDMLTEIESLPQLLSDVYNLLNESNSYVETNQALGLLQRYVQNAFIDNLNKISESKATLSQYFVSVEVYAKTGQVYHSKTFLGHQTFAMILLVLADDKNALSDEQRVNIGQLKGLLEQSALQPQVGFLAEAIIQAIANEGLNQLPSYEQAQSILSSVTGATAATTTVMTATDVCAEAELFEPIDKKSLLDANLSLLNDQLLPSKKEIEWDATFQLNCMHLFCFLGGTFLLIALLTCPAAAVLTGLTGLIGCSSIVPQVAAPIGVGSLLLGAGIFAYRCFNPDAEPSSNSIHVP